MKSRLMIPMSFVPEVKDKMTDFAEFYASLGEYYNSLTAYSAWLTGSTFMLNLEMKVWLRNLKVTCT